MEGHLSANVAHAVKGPFGGRQGTQIHKAWRHANLGGAVAESKIEPAYPWSLGSVKLGDESVV